MKIKLNKTIMIIASFILIITSAVFAFANNSRSVVQRALPQRVNIYSVYNSAREMCYLKSKYSRGLKAAWKKSEDLESDVFCIEMSQATPPTLHNGEQGTYYTLEDGEKEKYLLYALEHSTGLEVKKDYYVRQMGVYTKLGTLDKHLSSITSNDSAVLSKYNNFMSAVNSNNYRTTQDVTVSLGTSKITFTKNGSNYESNWIPININQPTGLKYQAKLVESKVNLSGAPSGTVIYKEDGGVAVNGNIGTSKKYWIKIPESSITSDISVSTSVTSKFEVGVARSYYTSAKYSDGVRFQRMIARDTKVIEKNTGSASSGVISNGGSVTITKTDENGKVLSGATFQLISSSNVSSNTMTTGADGKVTFKNVAAGIYTVKEVSPPPGYIAREANVVSVNSGQTTSITVKNTRAKGSVKVVKTNESGQKLSGATFQLKSGSSVIQTLTTNANGEALFTNIPTGNYELIETVAPVGYRIDDNQKTLNVVVEHNRTSVVNVVNKRITGTVVALKLDSLNDYPLSGAVFGLYNSEGNKISTGVTDVTGRVTFNNVPYGSYKVKEEAPPKGYVLNPREVSCSIQAQDQSVTCTVYNDRLRDMTFTGYNVKDSNGNIVGTLNKNKTYTVNAEISCAYKDLQVPADANLANLPIDDVKYAVAVTDGTVDQSSESITTSNIKGNIIKTGSLNPTTIRDSSSVWKNLSFKLPDDEIYTEAIIVIEFEASKDCDPTNNKLVIRLPITNPREDEIYMLGMEVYPSEEGQVLVGNDVNVKLNIASNSIKTYDVNSKITIVGPAGFGTKTLEKPIYGVSLENPGEVYFKFKPTVPGNYIITPLATIPGGSVTDDAQTIKAIYPSEPEDYKSVVERNQVARNEGLNIKTYVKVKKVDKDKIVKEICEEPCQKDNNGREICPGHDVWGWNDPYYAFIPVKETPLNGITEMFNITQLKFRSKTTENNVGKYPLTIIDEDGYVNMLNPNSAKYAQVKAGYGFDIKLKTEYKNNLPTVFNRARSAYRVPSDKSWTKYYGLAEEGSTIPFYYNNVEGNLKDYNANTAVSMTIPSIDDLIIESPNQIYMRLPDGSGEYCMVDEGYGQKFSSNKIKQNLLTVNYTGPVMNNTEYIDTKEFEFKKDNSNSLDKRGYYIGKNVKDGYNEISFYNRYAGYGLNNSTRLHDDETIKIKVYGGRYDDLKGTNS